MPLTSMRPPLTTRTHQSLTLIQSAAVAASMRSQSLRTTVKGSSSLSKAQGSISRLTSSVLRASTLPENRIFRKDMMGLPFRQGS